MECPVQHTLKIQGRTSLLLVEAPKSMEEFVFLWSKLDKQRYILKKKRIHFENTPRRIPASHIPQFLL